VSYCTLGQLTDRYGTAMLVELTDRAEEATGEIDTDAVDRAIADTDAMIDGYLAGRYALPLAEVPQMLTDLAQPIALYKLHRNVASEKVQRDYDGALRMLREIAKGELRLVGAAGAEPSSSGASGVRTNDRERDMT